MNVPRALPPPERSALEARSASLGANEVLSMDSNYRLSTTTVPSVLSLPSNPSSESATEASMLAVTVQSGAADSKPAEAPKRPPMPSQETDINVLARYAGESSSANAPKEQAETKQPVSEREEPQSAQQSVGDPLGVSSEEPQRRAAQQQRGGGGGGIDFAAFAQHNAFKDS